MDSVLRLRLAEENDSLKNFSQSEIMDLLSESKLVAKLTGIEQKNFLSRIWTLLGLAEIPGAFELDYTKELLHFINKQIATEAGFSYTGKVADIVPCYNAMLFEAYCRLGLAQTKEAQAALQWIKNYQVFDRSSKTTWPYDGICKHGGCMKKVPCFIGIGKTVRALITYQNFAGEEAEVTQLIQQGLAYMLEHHMFQRLSNQKPISSHITDLMFPQSYVLSFTDIIYILDKTNSWHRPEVLPVRQLLMEKQTKTGGWKIDYSYTYAGYVPFDTKRKDSEWLTNLFKSWLGAQPFEK